MPIFRPGKPYRLLGLTADTARAAGSTIIPFDDVDTDGEWGVGTGGGTAVLAIAGLYLVRCNVANTAAGNVALTINVDGNPVSVQVANRRSQASWFGQLVVGQVVTFLEDTAAAHTLDAGPTNAQVVRLGPVRWT